MMPLSLTVKSDEYVILSGDLTFATINQSTAQLINFKKTPQYLVIDFAQITQSDSAGLALIIEWLKMSHSAQKQIQFKNIPPQLLTLAQLSGFDITPYFSGTI